MARQTKKYTSACKVLGIPCDQNVPHEAVYGMLALRGYEWQQNRWKAPKQALESASVRIEAKEQYLESIVDAIAYLLESNSASVHSIKGPYKNRQGKNSRMYINFSHPTEWRHDD